MYDKYMPCSYSFLGILSSCLWPLLETWLPAQIGLWSGFAQNIFIFCPWGSRCNYQSPTAPQCLQDIHAEERVQTEGFSPLINQEILSYLNTFSPHLTAHKGNCCGFLFTFKQGYYLVHWQLCYCLTYYRWYIAFWMTNEIFVSFCKMQNEKLKNYRFLRSDRKNVEKI